MRFTKQQKEFVALTTAWATEQGWQFHRVDLGKAGISYHCLGNECGLVMGPPGKRDKEGLFNLCTELDRRFPHPIFAALPDSVGAVEIECAPKLAELSTSEIVPAEPQSPVHCVSLAVRRGRNADGGQTVDPGVVSRLKRKEADAV